MNYFVSREGNEYGPYTLSDLQRYVASGNIVITDLARSEAMNDWIPVSQIIGNIPVPLTVTPHVAEPSLRTEGNKLIVPRGAALPRYCVKCAQPVENVDWERNFSWCNPWFGLLILAGCIGLIIYLVMYNITRKQMKFGIPLCEEHRRSRRIKMWVGGVLMAASPLLLVLCTAGDRPEYVTTGVLGFFVVLIAGGLVLTQASPLRPKTIDDSQGVFAGAGDPFLRIIDAQSAQATRTGY